MTSIASIGAQHTSPLYPRSVVPRAQTPNDQVYDPVLDPAYQQVAAIPRDIPEVTVTAKATKSADDEPFSFWDMLDLINPLQHIPGVNTIYRELTGDTIKTPVKVIGATILGGPIGFAVAMADAAVTKSTGKDIGQHAMAMFNGNHATAAPATAPSDQTMVAQASVASDEIKVAQVAPRSNPPQAFEPAREFIPDPVLATPGNPAQKPAPNEAEAFVKTAQIAAQANVFPSFKRTGNLGAATAADSIKAQQQVAEAQVAQARGQMRFMPIKQNMGRPVAAAARNDGSPTTMSEMKARTKFAPGPVNAGGAALAPATLAVATAAQKTVSAQDAYNYGREAAAGKTPAEAPAWFDQAMLGAIDKYKAMQNAP